MGTDGAKDEVGDSTELELGTVGKFLVLVRIIGIDCVYKYLFVIQLPCVGEICSVLSVVQLGEGLVLLDRHYGVVYQEVNLFGDTCIKYPRPARDSFGFGRNIASTFGREAEDRITSEEV